MRHRGLKAPVVFSKRDRFSGEIGMSALQQSVFRLLGFGLVSILLCGAAAHATDLVIYDDALENGFSTGYSYSSTVAESSAQAHTGSKSIAVTITDFGAVALTNTTSYSTNDYAVLHFWIYGNAPGGQNLDVQIYADKDSGAPSVGAPLNQYISGGSVGSGVWREVTVPITSGVLSYNGSFNRIDLQNETSGTQPTFYIDDVSLQSSVVDEIFSNGFEGGAVTPPANGLVEDHDVTVLSMVSDQFTWDDSNSQPRVAVLAHNDGAQGPGGTYGGELRQFQYQAGGGTRTVSASGNGASGFGYVVSHPNDDGGPGCTGAKIDNLYNDPYDTSLLGHLRGGTWSRVFEGRHHAIFRFSTTYPRYCSTVAAHTGYIVPVTIDWTFSTGHDNPLWSITWDLSGVPQNGVEDDSRAPYGEMLFDGSATEGAHSVIAGVGWGDGYQFTSTTNPVTYNSAWTWNVPNTIPYVKLWTTAVDATMGTVQTQTLSQQDAGGYFDASFWGKTSAAGAACAGDEGDHSMPCSYNWDYQSINYSMGEAIGGSNSDSTNNTRLAWGTEFGFLGQSSYSVNGSSDWGGPRGNLTASGWPKKSYSLYIVLGSHATDAVAAQVTQMETEQKVSLAATVGSVATSGPAGVNRADTVNYSPVGYDPVYSALVFNAASNALTATIGVSSGALKNPMIIVRNYTSGSYPTTVKFGGSTLTMDVDYFPSLRSDKSELWITLNKNISGLGNAFQIIP